MELPDKKILTTNFLNFKNYILLILFVLSYLLGHSQAPEAVNYQAVVRDGAGAIVANQNVGIQLSVLQGSLFGTTVYQETFTPTTNTFGLVNMQIGTGSVQTGAFNTIDWGNGPYFIETAVDVTGGTNYVTISTTQFMSVPYALHSKTVDTTFLNNAINSVSTDNQNITGSSINGTDLIIGIENGTSDTVDLSSLTDADADSTNEIQSLSLVNDTLYLSGPSSVDTVDLVPYNSGAGGFNSIPIAMANIASNGTINVSSGNIIVNHVSAGKYDIDVTNYNLDGTNCVIQVTANGTYYDVYYLTSPDVSYDLRVHTHNINSWLNRSFSIIIYKP